MTRYALIADFPGYRVGDDGTVWTCKTPGRGSKPIGPWKILRQGTHPSGHKIVTLHKDNKPTSRYVHQLVLEAFVGPRPKGRVARHFPDANPANNRLENLQWGTWSQNNGCDKIASGTTNRGERCGSAKLNSNQVRQIKRRLEAGDSFAEIAKDYPVTRSAIEGIAKGRTWRHLEEKK